MVQKPVVCQNPIQTIIIAGTVNFAKLQVFCYPLNRGYDMNPIRSNNLEVKVDVFFIRKLFTQITGKWVGFNDFVPVKLVFWADFPSNRSFFLCLNKKTWAKHKSQVFCGGYFTRADPTGVEYSRSKSRGTGLQKEVFSVHIAGAVVRQIILMHFFVFNGVESFCITYQPHFT
jgi:hypothetical protein